MLFFLLSPFRKYIPQCVLHLLDHYISTKREIDGAKREMRGCLMLVDISGFTHLAENLCARGPAGVDSLVNVINNYFTHLIAIVRKHGGDVLYFVGDALVVFFRLDMSLVTCTEDAEVVAEAARKRALYSTKSNSWAAKSQTPTIAVVGPTVTPPPKNSRSSSSAFPPPTERPRSSSDAAALEGQSTEGKKDSDMASLGVPRATESRSADPSPRKSSTNLSGSNDDGNDDSWSTSDSESFSEDDDDSDIDVMEEDQPIVSSFRGGVRTSVRKDVGGSDSNAADKGANVDSRDAPDVGSCPPFFFSPACVFYFYL